MNNRIILTPLVLSIFFFGLAFSLFVYLFVVDTTNKSNESKFSYLLERELLSIEKEVNLNVDVLHALKSHHKTLSILTRSNFNIFALNLIKNKKSIHAVSWVPRITDTNRKEFENNRIKELGRNFFIKGKDEYSKIIRVKSKEEYFPVDFIEPLIGNKLAIGFDLSSNKTRLETLELAKKANKILATGRIKLIQEKENKFGFLAVLPVFEVNSSTLEGFYTGVFRIEDLLNTALKASHLDSSLLDLQLVDTTDNESKLLYTNSDAGFISEKSISMKILGRDWTLHAKPSTKLINSNASYLSEILLVLCLFITFLVTYILISKSKETKKLNIYLEEKKKDIYLSNKKLESLLFMFDKKVIASRTNKNGIITYATKAFCEISSYSKEELLGHSHRIIKHPDMKKEIYKELWRTISKGEIYTGEIKNKKKDGTFYYVNVTIFPEKNDEQDIIGYFAISEDITAKKEVEDFNETLSLKVEQEVIENIKKDKLLLQQSKLAAMGEMIGALAHQWRQPLNTLAIQLQFIVDDYEDGLVDKKYLDDHSNESMKLVNFMSKTIDDFRNFFNVDKVKTIFDIKRKILETTNILSAQLLSYNIKINVEGSSFPLSGHASEFQQVILNIVNNAKDVLVEEKIDDGIININIKSNDEFGYIIISDNAGGIDPSILERIFEPYFTSKEQGKGTGLGLYMSKMIIEDNMQGHLSVKNNNDGAEFMIKFKINNG
jgi:PAS domain S-box-containing protein